MPAAEMLPALEPPRNHVTRPVAVEPPKPVVELLPPANGAPAAARAGELVAVPEADVATRAKMSVGLQQQVGNARMGALVAKEAGKEAPKEAPKEEEPPAPKKEAPPAAKKEEAAPPKEKEKEPAAAKKAEGEAAEKKPAPPSPKKAIAPAVAGVKDRSKKAKVREKPGVLVGTAQQAAKDPKVENTRDASVATVKKLDDAKAAKVRREKFKSDLRTAIKNATPEPQTKSEAEEVMKTGGKKASAALQGSLATEKEMAAGSMKTAAATEIAPAQGGTRAAMKTDTPGPPPAPVSPAPVVPEPMPAERLDYSSDRAPTDDAMNEAGVTKDQLAKGNEPSFNKNLEERSKAEKHEAEAEATYRKSEKVIHAQTRAGAKGELAEELGNIHGARVASIGTVTGAQNATKQKDALERETVTNTITGFKNATRTAVDEILKAMETEAGAIFERGLKRAEERYEETFEEEKGGVGTWLTTWGDDWDDLIERSLKKAREEYFRQVDVAIDDVADLVDLKLEQAKNRVSLGRQQVDDYVNTLEGSVREFGVEALKEVEADFDAMESDIDQRRDALIDKLAQQYKASYERMQAKEEALREANKSLWKRIYDATVGLIKKIIAFKDMLVSVLRKAAEVIVDIISDPIGFLGNLVSAVMQGLENFMGNIGTHLEKGLMAWLFGALGGALQLPEKFDLKGIVSIILQVLGLTYTNFRARAVAIVGEPIVQALEETAEVFKIVMTEGMSGLWEYIKDKVLDLKSLVLDAIWDFIQERVLMAGIQWIIGLLNPASAFFKACKAIYDIVVFFVNRASQIAALISAIIDSIAAIAKGNLSAAIKWVEDALAKAIPVAIGFLAALLGLGDISGTIRKTIDRAQAPVNKAIDWVIHQAVKLVKVVGKGISSVLGKKEPEKDAKGKPIDKGQEVEDKGAPGHVALAEEVGAKLQKLKLPPEEKEAEGTLQSEGDKIAADYTPRLEPGVKMRVRVTDPPADSDEEIDFEVVIAPNTTKLKFRAHKEDFLPAEAGTYAELTGLESQKNTDGSGREAHHAPPVALAVALGSALTKVGSELLNDDEDVDEAAVLLDVGGQLTAATAAHGAGLSAILIHEDTHKHRHSDTNPRIHGSEMRKHLGRYLRGRKSKDVARTLKDQVVVNPGTGAFERQIKQVAENVSEETSLKAALVADGPEIVTRVYDAEASRSLGAVEVGLSKSEKDGSAKERRAAIAKLKRLANQTWRSMIKQVKW